jgi:hypothetical protein
MHSFTKSRRVIYSALISGLTASCTHTSGSANVAAQVAAAIAAVSDSSCATLNRLDARTPERLMPSEQYMSFLAASHTRKVCLLSAPDTVARRMSLAGLAVNNLITLEVPHDAWLWSTVRLKWLRYTRPGEVPIEGAPHDFQQAVTIPYEVRLVRWGSGWKAVRVMAVSRRDDR